MKIVPKKSLGQNFLLNKEIIKKIVDLGKITSNHTIIEIGPGTGNLSEEILKKKPKRFIAIEKDKQLFNKLKLRFDTDIELINQDGLPGDHHFYISFDSTHKGVKVPSELKASDDNEIKIILQHQFWDLTIDDQKFSECFCVNLGNPHIIFFDKNYLKHDLRVIGPKIENHDLFPEKTNVTFANVIDKKNIEVNVWERGAGLTKACGTAACATAVASFSKNLTERKVQIAFDQGYLKIEYNKDKNIFMTGPVSKINKLSISI